VKVTDETVEFIKRWEGFAPKSYWDYHQWSVGYGSVSYEGETVTEDVATGRLRSHLRSYATSLAGQLTRDPTPEQSTALLSASYNLGLRGTQNVVELFNSGDIEGAAHLLRRMDHAGGKRLDALTRRREAEARLLEVVAMRGAPRTQFARVYHLLDSSSSIGEFANVARGAYEDRSTIGFSYDDAGLGDLDSRIVILHGVHKGAEEWFGQHYPGVKVVREHNPAPVPYKPSGGVTGGVLCGLHGSADSCWGHSVAVLPHIVEMIKAGRIEAYKSLSNESADSVDVLKAINPDMFFMVRMMSKMGPGSTVAQFVHDVGQDVQKWYDKGVMHYEIHNEPNLKIEGCQPNGPWYDGEGFSRFWLEVRDHFLGRMPGALFGWPGLSPGPAIDDFRYDAMQFFNQARDAVNEADFLCCHSYWQHEADIYNVGGGQSWRLYPQGGVPIFITEYSNPSKAGKIDKAQQYVKFLDTLEGVHSAYSFVADASSSFDDETWTGEMAQIVGERDGKTA